MNLYFREHLIKTGLLGRNTAFRDYIYRLTLSILLLSDLVQGIWDLEFI